MNDRIVVKVARSPQVLASAAAKFRRSKLEQATLRLCISSPMVRPRATSDFSSMPSIERNAVPRPGPNTSRSQPLFKSGAVMCSVFAAEVVAFIVCVQFVSFPLPRLRRSIVKSKEKMHEGIRKEKRVGFITAHTHTQNHIRRNKYFNVRALGEGDKRTTSMRIVL